MSKKLLIPATVIVIIITLSLSTFIILRGKTFSFSFKNETDTVSSNDIVVSWLSDFVNGNFKECNTKIPEGAKGIQIISEGVGIDSDIYNIILDKIASNTEISAIEEFHNGATVNVSVHLSIPYWESDNKTFNIVQDLKDLSMGYLNGSIKNYKEGYAKIFKKALNEYLGDTFNSKELILNLRVSEGKITNTDEFVSSIMDNACMIQFISSFKAMFLEQVSEANL